MRGRPSVWVFTFGAASTRHHREADSSAAALSSAARSRRRSRRGRRGRTSGRRPRSPPPPPRRTRPCSRKRSDAIWPSARLSTTKTRPAPATLPGARHPSASFAIGAFRIDDVGDAHGLHVVQRAERPAGVVVGPRVVDVVPLRVEQHVRHAAVGLVHPDRRTSPPGAATSFSTSLPLSSFAFSLTFTAALVRWTSMPWMLQRGAAGRRSRRRAARRRG